MRSHLRNSALHVAIASSAACLLAVAGCVDPEGRYDDFIERTADMRRGGEPGEGGPVAGERIDFSGTYLLALSTTLAPGAPLLFSCEVTVAEDLSTFDLELQPVTTDMDAAPRTPVGETLSIAGVPYAEDGTFGGELGEVTVPGNANPISGSNIVATVAIAGSVQPMTADLPIHFCGDASGMVTVPLAFDLAGSTFGAVQTSSLPDTEVLAACP